MSSFEEPLYFSDVFNSKLFDYDVSNTLTIYDADRRYLAISGGTMIGQTIFNNQITVNATSIFTGTVSMSASVSLTAALTTTNTITANNINDAININHSGSSGRSNIRFQNDVLDYLESGIRSSGASNPRTHYLWSNGSYKLLMDLASGDFKIQSSTQASSYSTGCLQLAGGLACSKLIYADSLRINSTTNATSISTGSIITQGGIGCAKDIRTAGNITLNFGYMDQITSIFLAQDVSSSGLLTYKSSDRSCYMQSGSVAGIYGYYNFGANGLFINRSNYNPIGSCAANSLLDFGTESHAFQINLYGGSYGITAADNATQLLSGGTNGIYFGRASGYTATSYDMQLTQNGSLLVGNSIRASGFNTTGFSGAGVEIHYSTYGQIYSYNRSTLLYRALYLGNEVYLSGGNTSIGIGATSSSWRLEVGTNTQNVSSYGYLNSSSSTGTSGSSGAVAFSAYFQGRIAVQGEVDVLSDRRCKSDIRDISEEEATAFITKCLPKHYCFKPASNNEMQYGYIAQDICKAGLDTLIVCRHEEGLEEVIDGDGFISPKDTVFTVSYQKTPALLHKYILMQEDRIKRLEEQLELLLSRPVVRNWIEKQKNKE